MSLRKAITDYLDDAKRMHENQFDTLVKWRGAPTWWFKLHIPYETPDIRRELIRMEREGLVKADRSQSNNTIWIQVEKEQQP